MGSSVTLGFATNGVHIESNSEHSIKGKGEVKLLNSFVTPRFKAETFCMRHIQRKKIFPEGTVANKGIKIINADNREDVHLITCIRCC